nr:hypothetical protein [Mycobacterium eburneum]
MTGAGLRRGAVLAGAGLLVVAAAAAASAEPPPGATDIDHYPIAQGRYASPTDFYWVFFKTPDGRACGIGPNGGPVGCDTVPGDAPVGTNQTVVAAGGVAAAYRHSDTLSFTRDVDVLPEGQRLENWGASCGVGHQGTVTCRSYQHGFIISSVYGVLW